MSSAIRSVVTRFRAYQLGCAGSSFSYFAGDTLTLIEAKITDTSRTSVLDEVVRCRKPSVDTLHITSWDLDHCDPTSLGWLLYYLPPTRIEYPGYAPATDSAKECLAKILEYRRTKNARGSAVVAQQYHPPYIAGLRAAEALGYRDVVYHPKKTYDNANDNSTVKLFRGGSFNVLSLGDVQDPTIAAMLRVCPKLRRETDVMILAHHGANNGFTTGKFLDEIKPSVAICSSNWDNQHDHPRDNIRQLLAARDIPLCTTIRGDVVIESIGGHTADFTAKDFVGGTETIYWEEQFRAKKFRLLSMNKDTIRARTHPGFTGLR